MKKTKSLIISAMIMVFALAFTACGSKSSSVEGSWSGNDNGYDGCVLMKVLFGLV